MSWLVLIGGIQILGFGFTLARLVSDERQLKRTSRITPADLEDRQHEMEFEPWRNAATT